jgi:hypothetical protein
VGVSQLDQTMSGESSYEIEYCQEQLEKTAIIKGVVNNLKIVKS